MMENKNPDISIITWNMNEWMNPLKSNQKADIARLVRKNPTTYCL